MSQAAVGTLVFLPARGRGGSERDCISGNWAGAASTNLLFERVEYATTVGTRYSMPDEHAGIWICRNPKVPMEKLWPLAKIYR